MQRKRERLSRGLAPLGVAAAISIVAAGFGAPAAFATVDEQAHGEQGTVEVVSPDAAPEVSESTEGELPVSIESATDPEPGAEEQTDATELDGAEVDPPQVAESLEQDSPETRNGESVYEARVHGKIAGLPALGTGEYYEMTLVAFDPGNPPTTAKGFWQDVAKDGTYSATMWVPEKGTVFAADLYRRDAKGNPTFLGFLNDAAGKLEFTLNPGQNLQRSLVYKAPNAKLGVSVQAQTDLPKWTHWPAVAIYKKVSGTWLEVQSYYTLSLTEGQFGGLEARLPAGDYAVKCMTVGIKNGYVQPGDVKKSHWWNLKPTLAASNKITLKAGQTVNNVSCDMSKSVFVSSPDVVRWAGSNRFATSVAVSKAAFSPGVPVAFVASGMDFPDALSGAPAAAKLGGPVLLVRKGSVPADVKAELQRLKPKKIVVLGGSGVVSDSVKTALSKLSAGGAERWWGNNRYETSAITSQKAFPDGARTVFIADGGGFPDALSGGPAAGKDKGPILLVSNSGIPASVKTELKRLKPKKIVIIGGTGVVTQKVEGALAAYIVK